MKLVEMKCKNCGSILKVNPNSEEIQCQYCDTTFRIDDEVKKVHISHTYDDMEQSGYEFEKGRRRARDEELLDLYGKYAHAENDTSIIDKTNPIFYFFITFFFGILGGHKFLKGEVKKGFLYLFTIGLFGFGYLYDLVMAFIGIFKYHGFKLEKK